MAATNGPSADGATSLSTDPGPPAPATESNPTRGASTGRLGDKIFSGLSIGSGALIAVTLALVAIFLPGFLLVTATLPPFARAGSQTDVSVAAIGDAKSLLGGTLIMTPLNAADGEVYAVAQGAVATGAVAARGAAGSVQRGVPTSARVASGASRL